MRTTTVYALTLIALTSPLVATARDDSGVMLGVSVGEATNEVGEFKDSDTAFKLSAGYAFNQYFGIELAYVDAGTQQDTIAGVAIANESTGVIVSMLLSLPVGERISVFGRLGHAFYESDATGRLGDLVARDSESDDDLVYGAGFEYAAWGGLRLRVEYEVVDVREGDFDIASVGIFYRF